MRYVLSVILIVFAGWAAAQSYPEPSDLSVNDFAGILGEEAELRLTGKLDTLREETDVELVVLTLSRQEIFAPDLSLKDFAKGIFDEWGIGDETRNDGILVLVLRGDQAIRITLGEGFDNAADKASDTAVERSFLPAFREENYEEGIETGVDDLIENLVRPHVANRDAGTAQAVADPAAGDAGKEKPSASWLLYVLGGIGGLIALITVKARMRKCPKCGQKGLKTKASTVIEATETSTGQGERITTCEKCGYRNVESYTIAKRSKPEDKKEEFGGGKAGKGGTTGKW